MTDKEILIENEDEAKNDKEIHILDHLDELRNRLIIVGVALVIFFGISFFFVRDIFEYLTRDLTTNLIVLGPSDAIWIYFSLATVGAIAGTIPVLAWQIWLFVKPALKPKERKTALAYIPALFLLFIAGLAFGYYVVFPLVINFLSTIGEGLMDASYTADKYFKFIVNMTLPFGFLFEMPVVMMFLTSLGILNPYVLVKIRKYAYFVLIIIAILITPPEFMSDFVVSVPLLLLFEVSILFSKRIYKRKLKKEQEYEASLVE